MDKLNPNKIFNSRPAAQPGAHAPAGFVSKEYDEEIVNDQLCTLEKLESMTLEELEHYKLNELKHLLSDAGKNVPYWRRLFKDIKFDPMNISSLEDLKKR